MSTPSDFDRLASAWLAEGPTELNDRVLDAALHEVHLTHQRRRWAAPWRTPLMPLRPGTVALIALVAVVGVGVFAYLGRQPGFGFATEPPPTPLETSLPTASSPAAPTAAPSTRPTAPPSVFSSPIYGYSIALPVGWSSLAARLAWDGTSPTAYDTLEVDQFVGPTGTRAWAYAAPTSMTLSEFVAAGIAADAVDHPCPATVEVDEPTTLDGEPARLTVKHCPDVDGILVATAAVIHDGIGYYFYFQHPSVDTTDPDDIDVFRALLTGVNLP